MCWVIFCLQYVAIGILFSDASFLKAFEYCAGLNEEKAVEASKEEILETTESTEKTEMAAVAEPVKHSPEVEESNFKFHISGNRQKTTADRVMDKLFNN